MGLRIIQRVMDEYGGDADAHIAEEINPFTNPSRAKKALQAEIVTGSTPREGPFFNGNEEDIGGGFLANDDDPDHEDFSLEERDAMKVRHTADELAIENENDPIDSDPLADCPSADSAGKNCGPLKNDDCQRALIGPDLRGKATVSPKALTNGRKAAATVTGPKGDVPIDSPKKRAAPKRNAARQSETALKSQIFEQEDDGVCNSDGEISKSKEAAVEKSAQRKRNKKGSNPSARVRKRG